MLRIPANTDIRGGHSWSLRLAGGSRRVVAARVRRAMAADQLVLHCQPTVSCRDGRVLGAEALVRWRHRSGALIYPRGWLPAVEMSGLRNRFNLHVLDLAARHQDDWAALGLRLPLSVNVTPACLADEGFVATIERRFADRPASGLRLEITERTTAIHSHALKANIERLSALGFHFLLDDFGIGYSSLERLANLAVSTLKVDGSLVADVTLRDPHRAIVESVNHLAHALGLDVVCEGVENAATWAALQGLGCDYVQGYHIARPLPAERFPIFVQAYQASPPQAVRADERTFERRWAGDRRSGGADRRDERRR